MRVWPGPGGANSAAPDPLAGFGGWEGNEEGGMERAMGKREVKGGERNLGGVCVIGFGGDRSTPLIFRQNKQFNKQ